MSFRWNKTAIQHPSKLVGAGHFTHDTQQGKIREFIAELQSRYDSETEIVPIIWQLEDVLHRAEESGIKVTEEQAGQVIDSMT